MWRRGFNKDFINAFGTLGLLGIVKEVITDVMTKPYEAGSIDNHVLFEKDMDKVRFDEMTKKELDRNIRGGKYRDYSPPSNYDLWIKKIEKYMELYPNRNLNMDKIRLDYVKQQKNSWLEIGYINSLEI